MNSSLQYSASAKHWLWGRFFKSIGRVPVRKHWRQDRVARYVRCVKHLYLQWHHCLHCLHCPSLSSLPIIVINVCLCKSMQKAELWALRACFDVTSINEIKIDMSLGMNFLSILQFFKCHFNIKSSILLLYGNVTMQWHWYIIHFDFLYKAKNYMPEKSNHLSIFTPMNDQVARVLWLSQWGGQ